MIKAHVEVHGEDGNKKAIIDVSKHQSLKDLERLGQQVAARALLETGHVRTITIALKFDQ